MDDGLFGLSVYTGSEFETIAVSLTVEVVETAADAVRRALEDAILAERSIRGSNRNGKGLNG